MHEITNYEMMITRPSADASELLLLTVEQSDLPVDMGTPLGIAWAEGEDDVCLVISFGAGDAIVLPKVPPQVVDAISGFDRALLIWMHDGEVAGEAEVAF